MLEQNYLTYPGDWPRVMANASRYLKQWLEPGSKVLDVGAGTLVVSRLIEVPMTVLAIEPTPELAQPNVATVNALQHASCIPLCLRLDQLPSCKVFDAIIFARAIHEVAPSHQRLDVLNDAIDRFLKPGGRLILTDPFYCTQDVTRAQQAMLKHIGHIHPYSEMGPPTPLAQGLSGRFENVTVEEVEDEITEFTGGDVKTYWLLASNLRP